MSKINVRSPYFIYDNSTNGTNALSSAQLRIHVYTGNSTSSITGYQYQLKFYCHKTERLLLKYRSLLEITSKTL